MPTPIRNDVRTHRVDIEREVVPTITREVLTLDPYSRVEFGYCRKFPDADQVASYAMLRWAGLLDENTPVVFNAGRSVTEVLRDPAVAKLEASYHVIDPDDPQYDPSLVDLTAGNFTHQLVNSQEITATTAAFINLEPLIRGRLREIYPDSFERKMAIVRRLAEYLQRLELTGFKDGEGAKRPTLVQLLQGAQFSHYAHPALGISETNPQAAIEAAFGVLQTLVEQERDPFDTIDVSWAPELPGYLETQQALFEHDRAIISKERPSVIETPLGVNVGYLDARSQTIGEQMINPQGGFNILGVYSDPFNRLQSDVMILVSDNVDINGQVLGTKIQVSLNLRNKHAKRKLMEMRADLSELIPMWEDLEYTLGLGPDVFLVDFNTVGGHSAELPVGGRLSTGTSAEPEYRSVMTIINSPAETGSGIDPQLFRSAVEDYFGHGELATDAEMLSIANRLGFPDAVVRNVPMLPPRQRFHEKAFFVCNVNPTGSAPEFHTHTESCLTLKYRESDVNIERDESGLLIEARALYLEEKVAATRREFARCLTAYPRLALEQLATGYIDHQELLEIDNNRLLVMFDGLSYDTQAIDELFNPANARYDPSREQLAYYLREAVDAGINRPDIRAGIETTKFTHPDSLVHLIDSDLTAQLSDFVATSGDELLQDKLVTTLARIVRSPAYQKAQESETMRDRTPVRLLEIALNQTGQFSETAVAAAREVFSGETISDPNKARILREFQLTYANKPEIVREVISIIGVEVSSDDAVMFVEKDRGLPNEIHVALTVGRLKDERGKDIIEVIAEAAEGAGEVDYAYRQGQLANKAEIGEAEKQLADLLMHAVESLLARLPDGEVGTVNITHQLTGMLSIRLGAEIQRLKSENPGKFDFKLYQWVQGRYELVGEI